jgi:Carbamoylphosphate synthase small subunit
MTTWHEGQQSVDIPAFSVQYHPEAAAVPQDAAYRQDRIADLRRSAKEGTLNA